MIQLNCDEKATENWKNGKKKKALFNNNDNDKKNHIIKNWNVHVSVEKFIGWSRYSNGMWPNEVYFSTWSSL